MIDERRIGDKTKYGTQYDIGNIALSVTTELWGGRWHKPTVQLSILGDNPAEIKYSALTALELAFNKAWKEWALLDLRRLEKNRQISQNVLGAS